jgi:hypothetical protein
MKASKKIQQMNKKYQALINVGFEFNVTIHTDVKPYGEKESLKGKKFLCIEISGTRITIEFSKGRQIDFHISEIELHPQYYSQKELSQIILAEQGKLN